MMCFLCKQDIRVSIKRETLSWNLLCRIFVIGIPFSDLFLIFILLCISAALDETTESFSIEILSSLDSDTSNSLHFGPMSLVTPSYNPFLSAPLPLHTSYILDWQMPNPQLFLFSNNTPSVNDVI